MTPIMKITGKVSHFGGPKDTTGVTSSEDLAFWEHYEDVAKPEELFLPEQPEGTTGLARRLDPEKFYIACRWDYDVYPKSSLKTGDHLALVRSPSTNKHALARPADYGPNPDTDRVTDISPGLMNYLGIETDDVVEVIYPFGEGSDEEVGMTMSVAISAGHGKKIAGAHGYIKEEVETPLVMREVAQQLRDRGVTVYEFWDQTSTTQQANLDTIINWHNSLNRDLDVSIHFNSSEDNNVPQAIGTECWYVTQQELAAKISAAIAQAGLKDRGAKHSGSLAFLNQTEMPSVLAEVCFVNSKADTDLYAAKFDVICAAIAAAISGKDAAAPIEPPVPPDQVTPIVEIALTVPHGVDIKITVNGDEVLNVFE